MSDKPHIRIMMGGYKAFEVFDELPPTDGTKFVCKRDHGDIGHDVLQVVMADGKGGYFCLRCIVNLLSSCQAIPEEDVGYGGE